MKLEEKIALLKESRIIDGSELFARVTIIYSELAQTVGIIAGATYGTQGRDGYIGICENHLVLFESSILGGKPKTEVFREPLEQVEFLSLKSVVFGLAKVLRVKVGGKKFKITAPYKQKPNLIKIGNMLHK